MTVRRSIIGIFLFAAQIGIATFYGESIDLKIVIILGVLTFGYILYKFINKKYDSD